ncbi:MAG: A/G-specific adenine glycosylase [Eubacteriales bacterium]|nr:A/G-specific adenine glycosylase [Eubacteriales bacterium]
MEFNWNECKTPLLNWYQINHRQLPWRDEITPYHVWISEIMLQQTRVESVKGYYIRFLDSIPNIEALASVSDEQLLKLWEGLGYYNRAKNLKKAAQMIINQYNGEFPKQFDEVIKLPGIGEYTAGAICSICFDACTPAVDGNVLRVVMRVLNCNDNIDDIKTKRNVRKELISMYETGDCALLTQAFMELGATICIPNGEPKCLQCPIANQCKAYHQKTYQLLPVRNKKKKRKIINMTVFVLHTKDHFGVRKRNSSGLLANLWEFYHVEEHLAPQQALDYITKQGYEPIHIEKEIPYTHIFTHVEWHMVAYYVSCARQTDDLLWISKKRLLSEFALPTAFRVFLEKTED